MIEDLLSNNNDYRMIGSVMSDQRLRDLCSGKGLAHTHQRQVIWETLRSMHGHPSPEAVYDIVRERIPSISLATVYKNIRTFIEHGMLAEVSLHHGSARLETNPEPHHHFVCVQCREIADIPQSDIGPVTLKNAAPEAYEIHRYSVEIHGLCQRCARRRHV
jgi:Fur family peroxide stress response transcriptional regulator